ncbi:TPA: hypothetical protein HA219_00160 [Candidatus Woesearchaeota archaeon]|nr:hypothetical protein [Candidatus Woesearchaeota archaeon]HIH39128.1 hypothetical protein [Candidatus Woesearchaeota archaeon]
MSKTRYVQVRVNQDQLERIKNNASAKGYRTISHYARDLMLEKNLFFERKFEEMYQEVLNISKRIK